MIEDKIRTYAEKVKALKEITKEIEETIPELIEMQRRLAQEVASDKSVIQKELKDLGDTLEVDGHWFKMSTRTRSSVTDDFMFTALDLGHLELLIEAGAITWVKVNEDVISRLDPEVAGIYNNLIQKKPYKALTWPKGFDV